MNKKYTVSILSLMLALCVLVSISLPTQVVLDHGNYSTKGLELHYTVDQYDSKDLALLDNRSYTPKLGKSFLGFKQALGFKESQNNYFAVNTLGYLGKYQFGRSTLNLLGVYDVELFLNTPELQEKAFIANTQRNKWVLRRDIKRFSGKYINGVLVTESGILAAAHLAGPGSVKKYLRSYGKDVFSDAYGSTVFYYMKRFRGFDTSSIEANKRPKVEVSEA